jgi:hypothetical protein
MGIIVELLIYFGMPVVVLAAAVVGGKVGGEEGALAGFFIGIVLAIVLYLKGQALKQRLHAKRYHAWLRQLGAGNAVPTDADSWPVLLGFLQGYLRAEAGAEVPATLLSASRSVQHSVAGAHGGPAYNQFVGMALYVGINVHESHGWEHWLASQHLTVGDLPDILRSPYDSPLVEHIAAMRHAHAAHMAHHVHHVLGG